MFCKTKIRYLHLGYYICMIVYSFGLNLFITRSVFISYSHLLSPNVQLVLIYYNQSLTSIRLHYCSTEVIYETTRVIHVSLVFHYRSVLLLVLLKSIIEWNLDSNRFFLKFYFLTCELFFFLLNFWNKSIFGKRWLLFFYYCSSKFKTNRI